LKVKFYILSNFTIRLEAFLPMDKNINFKTIAGYN